MAAWKPNPLLLTSRRWDKKGRAGATWRSGLGLRMLPERAASGNHSVRERKRFACYTLYEKKEKKKTQN